MPSPKTRIMIRVYGDSLSLPRSIDGIGYLDTYPELMRQTFEAAVSGVRVGVLNRSIGGKPITGLYQQFVDDGAYMGDALSDILVIQCGIVDCAPRPVPPPFKRAIGGLPVPLRWLAARFLHYARPLMLRIGLRWRNTSLGDFETTLDRWLGKAATTSGRIYVINIAPTTADTERHSPGLTASIGAFNNTIARTVGKHIKASLVDVHARISRAGAGEPPYVNPADGHHITPEGHRLYANMILATHSPERQSA